MGNAHKKGGLPGRIALDARWHTGNELVAYGRKSADYDPAAFQGILGRYGHTYNTKRNNMMTLTAVIPQRTDV